MIEIKTPRLQLTKVQLSDAEFILELYNDPDFIYFIADRNLRNLSDTKNFIRFLQSDHDNHSILGLYVVSDLQNNSKLGICSYFKRDHLEYADIGFAFLKKYRQQGYAFEATLALMQFLVQQHQIKNFCAITHIHNHISGALLLKLGFTFKEDIKNPKTQELSKLYLK